MLQLNAAFSRRFRGTNRRRQPEEQLGRRLPAIVPGKIARPTTSAEPRPWEKRAALCFSLPNRRGAGTLADAKLNLRKLSSVDMHYRSWLHDDRFLAVAAQNEAACQTATYLECVAIFAGSGLMEFHLPAYSNFNLPIGGSRVAHSVDRGN